MFFLNPFNINFVFIHSSHGNCFQKFIINIITKKEHNIAEIRCGKDQYAVNLSLNKRRRKGLKTMVMVWTNHVVLMKC